MMMIIIMMRSIVSQLICHGASQEDLIRIVDLLIQELTRTSGVCKLVFNMCIDWIAS